MGRAGILFSHVAKAAAKLVDGGKNPTVDSVREALGGTGSKSTIAPMLKRWKSEHAEDIVETELGVPAELLHAVKGVYDKLQADVQQQLAVVDASSQTVIQGATDRADRLTVDNRALSETNEALLVELKNSKDALTHLQAEQQILNVTIATLQSDNGGLQQRLTDRATEIAALNLQLSQSRVQFEHYQEATARQRSEERQAAEQRIARAEQELANAQRQLVAQQSTIGQQEARLSAATEESVRLQEAAQQTGKALVSVTVERDQLSYQTKEMITIRQEITGKLDSVQHQLTEMCIVLAVKEKEVELLAEQLARQTDKAESLERDQQRLLQENTRLQTEADTATSKRRRKA